MWLAEEEPSNQHEASNTLETERVEWVQSWGVKQSGCQQSERQRSVNAVVLFTGVSQCTVQPCVCVCGVDFSGHFHRLSCSGINSCSHRENVFFFNLHHMNTVQRQTIATRAPWQPTAAAGNTCFHLFSRECFHHLHLLTFYSKCMNVHIYAHIFIYSLYICIYRGRDIDQTDQWLALALGSNDSVDLFYLITNWLD